MCACSLFPKAPHFIHNPNDWVRWRAFSKSGPAARSTRAIACPVRVHFRSECSKLNVHKQYHQYNNSNSSSRRQPQQPQQQWHNNGNNNNNSASVKLSTSVKPRPQHHKLSTIGPWYCDTRTCTHAHTWKHARIRRKKCAMHLFY